MLTLKRIDELGAVKASIAALELKAKALVEQIKSDMIRHETREAEGEIFRATYTVTETVRVDAKAVQAAFPRSERPEFYSSSLVESLRVTARTGLKLAA